MKFILYFIVVHLIYKMSVSHENCEKDQMGLQNTEDHGLFWSWDKLVFQPNTQIILQLRISKFVDIIFSFKMSSKTLTFVDNWSIYENISVHVLFHQYIPDILQF